MRYVRKNEFILKTVFYSGRRLKGKWQDTQIFKSGIPLQGTLLLCLEGTVFYTFITPLVDFKWWPKNMVFYRVYTVIKKVKSVLGLYV